VLGFTSFNPTNKLGCQGSTLSQASLCALLCGLGASAVKNADIRTTVVGFHFIQDNLQASLYPLCFCGEEARHKKENQGSEAESAALAGL